MYKIYGSGLHCAPIMLSYLCRANRIEHISWSSARPDSTGVYQMSKSIKSPVVEATKSTKAQRKASKPVEPVTVVGSTGKPIAVETVEQRRAKVLASAGLSPNALAVMRLLAQQVKGSGKKRVVGWVGHKVLRGIAPTAKTLGAVTSKVTSADGELTLGVQGGGLQARGLVESALVEAIGVDKVNGGGRLAARLTPAGIAYVESLPS